MTGSEMITGRETKDFSLNLSFLATQCCWRYILTTCDYECDSQAEDLKFSEQLTQKKQQQQKKKLKKMQIWKTERGRGAGSSGSDQP